MLFGDGGSVILKKGNGLKAIHTSNRGNIAALNIPVMFRDTPWQKETETRNTIEMRAGEVYKFAIGAFLNELGVCLKKAGMVTETIWT